MQERDWLIGLLLLCVVVVFSNGLHYVLFKLIGRKQSKEQRENFGIHQHLNRPARAVLFWVAVLIALPFVPAIGTVWLDRVEQVAVILLVLCLGWLAIGAVYVFEIIMHHRFDIKQADNLRARRIHTQLQFFRRIIIAFIVIIDLGVLLWSFHDPRLWQFGTGLIASAGLASLVLAIAAKSTASNLLAGMQIAFTEPIRIDDVVVIAGEWGRIAEITSTYVVLNIWDQRTLIVPLTYFIEQPFANWTRSGAQIMGTAFLYVDYTVPVEPLRAELQRIVETTPVWDGRVSVLQVTNLTERTMELRCLVSSEDSGKNFGLRCIVREKMIDFVRANYPDALPTMRVEMHKRDGEEALPPPAKPGA
ncbi:MAG TPA: mechanosensitive ion channel domain-containing protein [Terracidiphilus sp.]|nr:mechanosensitive ion channel domain-containing protein [Terracidiphilus sp.]